jgi:hypothetical protein
MDKMVYIKKGNSVQGPFPASRILYLFQNGKLPGTVQIWEDGQESLMQTVEEYFNKSNKKKPETKEDQTVSPGIQIVQQISPPLPPPILVKEKKKPDESFNQGMISSAWDTGRPFEAIDIVFGMASENIGCFTDTAMISMYENALQRLKESAMILNADGVLFVRFETRTVQKSGCLSIFSLSSPGCTTFFTYPMSNKAIEVTAWGTAIRWIKHD